MVSVHAYPTFELSDTIPLLAKLLLERKHWGYVRKSPTVRKPPSLPYLEDALCTGELMAVHKRMQSILQHFI